MLHIVNLKRTEEKDPILDPPSTVNVAFKLVSRWPDTKFVRASTYAGCLSMKVGCYSSYSIRDNIPFIYYKYFYEFILRLDFRQSTQYRARSDHV